MTFQAVTSTLRKIKPSKGTERGWAAGSGVGGRAAVCGVDPKGDCAMPTSGRRPAGVQEASRWVCGQQAAIS